MFFSVIIPTLNTPGIEAAVASLEAQAWPRAEYELIVVGLEPEGRVRLSEVTRFERSARPLAPAAARNRGARLARGDVLAFMDADCRAAPDWLPTLAADFADPRVRVVGGGVRLGTGNYWNRADNISMFHAHLDSLPPGERGLLPSLNLAVRRQTFLEAGGFDERYPRPAGEDADLSVRLRQRGWKLVFNPRAVVTHQPPRHSLNDLLRHAYYQGQYSVKVDARYRASEGLPAPFDRPWGLWLGGPALALAASVRVYQRRELWRYWPTWPAVLAAKLAWCAGAARTLRDREKGSE